MLYRLIVKFILNEMTEMVKENNLIIDRKHLHNYINDLHFELTQDELEYLHNYVQEL